MSYSLRCFRYHAHRARRRAMRPVAVATFLMVSSVVACGDGDRSDRDALLLRANAQQLVGAWDVTMVLERPLTQLHSPRSLAAPVTGTAAFTANRHSELNFANFGVVTHKAAFDVDLTSFNLPFGDEARTQSAVARTVPIPRDSAATNLSADRDSIIIALIPEDSRLTVRMAGVLAGDTVTGTWVAEFLRTEASGRFSMQRHRAPR